MNRPLLELRKLSTLHLKPLSLSLYRGEITTLQGTSGAGKSLLLRSICDLIEHQGEIFLDDLSHLKIAAHKWRRSVGMLAAESHWWHETIGEHFCDPARISEPLLQLGLSSAVLDQGVSHCSTGERQRLALIRLLQNEPQVLLLDEPTSGLDQTSALKVEEMVKSYVKQHQATAIWISHDPEQCRRVATHQLLMDNGLVSEDIR
ncbi:MAG: ATP-binding cassette domain-containing protein [Gammaproteobacteria bacterium]|nr:ATP-binding cassette domain-containing protein [Gammaproteobacteria bacterium]